MSVELIFQILTGVLVIANLFLTLRLTNTELRIRLWCEQTFVNKMEWHESRRYRGENV